MGMIIKFYCPVHKEIKLFEEQSTSAKKASSAFRLTIVESPQVCIKCGKAYYKWECKEQPKQDTYYD
jgi:hypothetical protein